MFNLASNCNIFGHLPSNYVGQVNKTKSETICQKWTDQYPHAHSITPEDYPGKGLGDHNYCRNPDNEPNGAWCYTTDINSRWEYCDCGMLLDLNRSKLKLLKIK